MRVGAGCGYVLLMRLPGSDPQRVKEDVRGLTVVACPGEIAIATRGWPGCGSWFRTATRSSGSTWPSLLKMFPTCFSTDRSATTKIPAIAALERPLGHQCEHVAFPGGERAEPVVGAAGGQKLGHDLWIECGAPAAT